MLPEINDETIVEIKTIKTATIMACPFKILMPEHYDSQGCKCGVETERKRMIKEWGYKKRDFKNIPLRK